LLELINPENLINPNIYFFLILDGQSHPVDLQYHAPPQSHLISTLILTLICLQVDRNLPQIDNPTLIQAAGL